MHTHLHRHTYACGHTDRHLKTPICMYKPQYKHTNTTHAHARAHTHTHTHLDTHTHTLKKLRI